MPRPPRPRTPRARGPDDSEVADRRTGPPEVAIAHAPTGLAPGEALAAAVVATEALGARPEILGPLVLGGTLYAVGWWRLRRRAPGHGGWVRAALALTAWGSLGLALLSPLDRLAHALFVAHMTQHMLLIVVAAPALLLADPFPVLIWALPRAGRRALGRWLRRQTPVGRFWRALTSLPVTWLASALILWLWHLPGPYDAALGDRLLHDLQHVTFFAGAILFWWPVIDPAPHFRPAASYGSRVIYLVLAAFPTAGLGLWLTVTPWVLYPSYASAPRLADLSAAEDQVWGGLVMWGAGSLIDMLAVLLLLWRFLAGTSRPAPPLDRPRAAPAKGPA